MAASRTRNYAFIAYPESSDINNIHNLLSEKAICHFISPVHTDLEKPHYHIMMMFSSVKSEQQARDIISECGGVGCEVIRDTKLYARYLCHLDSPDKQKYSPDDVLSFGNDYKTFINNEKEDKSMTLLLDLLIYIEAGNFRTIRELCRSLLQDCMYDEVKYVSSHAFFIREYLR